MLKKYFSKPIYALAPETYLTFLIMLAPCLYFLSGANTDLYSPSMPAIADYFHASIVATKNTIAATTLGWAMGGFTFGILIDSVGRKKILVIGMFGYVLSSIAALFCHSIHQLLLVRCIQGFAVSSIIGSRVLIMDLLSGHRFTVAMLYTSIGYGLGPIIGPFVGGILQHYIGWRANFFALVLIGLIILVLLVFFIEESNTVRHPLKISNIAKRCLTVISNKEFMCGVIIGGVTQTQLMIYATLGPFIVENLLHHTAITFGNSALIVGVAYVAGSLVNRLLLKYITPKQICDIGFVIIALGLLSALLFSFIATLELTTLMLPLFLTSTGIGFLFPNILSANLKRFAHFPGIAMAVQSCLLLTIASLGLFLISHVVVENLFQLTLILFVLAIIDAVIFYRFYRKSLCT